MPRWLVELVGEKLDTEELPRWFPNGAIHAVEKDGTYYLTGESLEACADGSTVRADAAEALKGMSATISLLWPAFHPPQVGHVLREHEDGRRDIWMMLEGITLRTKTGALLLSTGNTAASSQTQAQTFLATALASFHLREALYVWADPYRTWGRLYRILEEIERHLGRPASSAGLCSNNERERFTRSANSAEVAGVGARHASGKFQPPERPMTLDEAEAFIRQLLGQTLRMP